VGASGTAYLSMLGNPYHEEPTQEVFGAGGGAAIYRRDAISQVGFFDPRFFVYYEDVDLAWRLRWAGWRAVAAPRARVHHKGSAFARYAPKTYHLHKNKLAVIVQNWPISVILHNLADIMAMEISSIFFSVFKERSLDSVKARCAFIRELPMLMLERRRRLRKRVPGAEKWVFDDRTRALNRLKWKLK